MLARLVPRSLEGQLVVVVALSFGLLLAVLAGVELARRDTVVAWAESDFTIDRLRSIKPVLDLTTPEQTRRFLRVVSSCHRGSTVTEAPFPTRTTAETDRLRRRIAGRLALDEERVVVGSARLSREDFSYADCAPGELDFPIDGIVISLRLDSGLWLNGEVHPHQWHSSHVADWLLRAGLPFVVVGSVAVLLVRRLSRPLGALTRAARRFGERLETAEVEEAGPPDVRRAIEAFNAMQREVTGEVERRARTLAAVGHDLRTPLTALRIKAELVEDAKLRRDLIENVDGLSRLAASAIDLLRGESRAEPMRSVDLGTLVRSECDNFSDRGERVVFRGRETLHYRCRPEALARAARNLIENAVKYGGGAEVELRRRPEYVEVVVADRGPGIPEGQLERMKEPFRRLSKARESGRGGLGLGLAIAKAVCEGHRGELVLANREPGGLVAVLRLPVDSPASGRGAGRPATPASRE